MAGPVPVRLRGHHFLCILTFRGLGYTPAFVANMGARVAAVAAGAPVVLCDGPDEICAGFTPACRLTVDHDCADPETLAMDRLAAEAVGRVLGRDLAAMAPLSGADIALLRREYRTGSIRAACEGCSWKEFCDEIAADGFSGTRL